MNDHTSCSPAPVILLDTNVLHYLDLYTKQARQCDWYPFGDKQGHAGLDKGLKKAYGTGEAVLRYILTSDVRVQYSPMSELELVGGRLRGRAMLRAADEGAPDRMWSNYRESEIAQRLVSDDFESVHAGIGDLLEVLRERDVDAVVSHGEGMSEVWNIARELATIVFLDAKDCVIYASALVIGAKYLVTADSYLLRTATRIRQTPRGTGAQVRTLMARAWPGGGVPALPEAKRPTELAPEEV